MIIEVNEMLASLSQKASNQSQSQNKSTIQRKMKKQLRLQRKLGLLHSPGESRDNLKVGNSLQKETSQTQTQSVLAVKGLYLKGPEKGEAHT